jgi:hypothetical protein
MKKSSPEFLERMALEWIQAESDKPSHISVYYNADVEMTIARCDGSVMWEQFWFKDIVQAVDFFDRCYKEGILN